jgi:hypothetical protein
MVLLTLQLFLIESVACFLPITDNHHYCYAAVVLILVAIGALKRAVLVLFTVAAAIFAATLSGQTKSFTTVAVCCIVTAIAFVSRMPAYASAAGMLFSVIVINDAHQWDWELIYAFVVAFFTSSCFHQVWENKNADVDRAWLALLFSNP